MHILRWEITKKRSLYRNIQMWDFLQGRDITIQELRLLMPVHAHQCGLAPHQLPYISIERTMIRARVANKRQLNLTKAYFLLKRKRKQWTIAMTRPSKKKHIGDVKIEKENREEKPCCVYPALGLLNQILSLLSTLFKASFIEMKYLFVSSWYRGDSDSTSICNRPHVVLWIS